MSSKAAASSPRRRQEAWDRVLRYKDLLVVLEVLGLLRDDPRLRDLAELCVEDAGETLTRSARPPDVGPRTPGAHALQALT